MKKYMVILIAGMSLASLDFTASIKAKIEKLDPGCKVDLLVVEDECSLDLQNSIKITAQSDLYKLEALVPETITIEPCGDLYAEWKPFGKEKTKYHSHWLFNPLKLC